MFGASICECIIIILCMCTIVHGKQYACLHIEICVCIDRCECAS